MALKAYQIVSATIAPRQPPVSLARSIHLFRSKCPSVDAMRPACRGEPTCLCCSVDCPVSQAGSLAERQRRTVRPALRSAPHTDQQHCLLYLKRHSRAEAQGRAAFLQSALVSGPRAAFGRDSCSPAIGQFGFYFPWEIHSQSESDVLAKSFCASWWFVPL